MAWMLLIVMGCFLLYMVNTRRRALRQMDDCSKTVKHANQEFAEFAANICLNTYWRV